MAEKQGEHGLEKGRSAREVEKRPQPSPSSRALVDPFAFFDELRTGNPFRAMRRLMDEMNRVVEDFDVPAAQVRSLRAWSPHIDVVERDGRIFVRADLPGVKPEDVNVEIDRDVLIVEGERGEARDEERGGVWRSERRYGSFRRAIPLPEGVDVENANARFENGVLEVSIALPAQQAAQRKRIAIEGAPREGEQRAPQVAARGEQGVAQPQPPPPQQQQVEAQGQSEEAQQGGDGARIH